MNALRFEKMADRPAALPLLAEWYFSGWGRHATDKQDYFLVGKTKAVARLCYVID